MALEKKEITVLFKGETYFTKVGKGFDDVNKKIRRSRGLLKELATQKAALEIRQSFAKTE